VRTLRNAKLTGVHEPEVATVVCVQAKGTKEPWRLVASDPKARTKTLIGYYGKRSDIETSFRDIRNLRFGMGMSSTSSVCSAMRSASSEAQNEGRPKLPTMIPGGELVP